MAESAEVHSFFPTSPLARLPVPARSLPTYRCDVLVVGSGVAGLCAALAAADEGAHVMVLSKGRLEDSNTRWAQGGMAAALSRDDRPEFHAGDTIQVGCGLSDPSVVDAITARGPEAVRWLLEIGMKVDRDPGGGLSLSREGGHRIPRVVHSGGTATGLELQRVLVSRARADARIDFYPYASAVDLLRDAEGRVAGLLALLGHGSRAAAEPVLLEAGAVILATGGGGQLYRETTNPQLATGDGVSMALRAGAELRDLEFVQFHPTTLYLAGAGRVLISEVTRGAGAVLRDRNGDAFMESAHPDSDLAPRDVVSRAIFRRIVETGDTHVYLDFSGVESANRRFPALSRITSEFGLDLDTDPIPVRPAAHYFIGGIAADLDGRTSLEGLWATGECASIGFHGANRMGSNSLLEGLVHGRMVGAAAARNLGPAVRRFLLPSDLGRRSELRGPSEGGVELNLTDMTYSLKSLMWRQVGIERDAANLEDALPRLETWEGYLARLGPFTGQGVELVNMVQLARVTSLAALFRSESRGAHFRTDCPQPREEWQVRSCVSVGEGGLYLRTAPVSASAPAAEAKS